MGDVRLPRRRRGAQPEPTEPTGPTEPVADLALCPLNSQEPVQAETVEQLEKLQNVGPVCRELALNTSSQEHRLKTYGMVREATGYDVTDPWLSDDNMETLSVLRCGSLAVITGSEDLCAFLGASPHKDGFMLVRHLRSLKLMSVPSDALVSIPSPPPRPGDKAVFMGLNDRKLNGWPCSCGPIGQPKSNPSGSSDPSDEKQGNWFWAIYMRQDTRSNTLQNTEMLLVHESNLAVLPSAPGRVHSSLDDSVPRQLLQPLACSVEEENALLFAQNQVRVMLACAGPHPGHEVVALKELRQELENSGRLQGDSTSCSLVATVSAQSAIEDERDQEQRVKDEFFLHMQEVRRRQRAIRDDEGKSEATAKREDAEVRAPVMPKAKAEPAKAKAKAKAKPKTRGMAKPKAKARAKVEAKDTVKGKVEAKAEAKANSEAKAKQILEQVGESQESGEPIPDGAAPDGPLPLILDLPAWEVLAWRCFLMRLRQRGCGHRLRLWHKQPRPRGFGTPKPSMQTAGGDSWQSESCEGRRRLRLARWRLRGKQSQPFYTLPRSVQNSAGGVWT